MNIKPSLFILPTIAIGALLMVAFHSVAIADPGGYCDSKQIRHEQMSPEKMREYMKRRLDQLAGRLEIKASQQAAWEEFAQSVGMVAEQNVKKPNEDADAATIARYRAEKATEFAGKQTRIADTTVKLQEVLTEDQRKILDQTARHFLHENRGWSHKEPGMYRKDHDEWGARGSPEGENHYGGHESNFW